jgi:GAF domain-containing protein
MDYNKVLKDPARVALLRDLQLVDTPAEAAFDRLTRLASKIVGAPVALVSIVDENRQFFKSAVGLSELRETPLSHSFCQHVVVSGDPLVISDARKHPLVHDNLAIPDLNVIAYLGMPLQTTDGDGLGSFCVIDNEPREWTQQEIEIMRELAESVMAEIELRYAYMMMEKQNRQLQRMTEFCHSTLDQMASILERGAEHEEMQEYIDFARVSLRKAQKAQTGSLG